MNHRFACLDDAAMLAEMNRQLIDDEAHRNAMTVEELEDRMRKWLMSDYQAVVFTHNVSQFNEVVVGQVRWDEAFLEENDAAVFKL